MPAKKPMHKTAPPELPLPPTRNTGRAGKPLLFTPYQRIPQPNGEILFRPCAPVAVDPDEEIGTAEAAKIIGVSVRRVQQMCDEGPLVEGRDWRRPIGNGFYKIKRASAIRASGRPVPEA